MASLANAAPPAGWTLWPALDSQPWRPDLFATAGCRSVDEAADLLARTIAADPPPGRWLRLDQFDLAAVGFCPTCQPPPADPHRYVDPETVVDLTDEHFTFFAAAASAVAPAGLRCVAVIPPGTPLPLRFEPPANLWLLLAPRADLAAQAEEWQRWRPLTSRVYCLVSDGLGEFFDLPLNGVVAARRAAQVPQPAVLAPRVSSFLADGPDWLTQRLTAVLDDGETCQEGDWFRTDLPPLAQVLDIFAPVPAELAGPLVTSTTEALRWVITASERRAHGELVDRPSQAVVTRLDQLAPGLAHAVAGQAPALRLPPPPRYSFDGLREPGEWDSALRLELGDPGAARPATVYVAADETALHLAVTATEPDPAQATLQDRLAVLLAGPDPGGAVTWVTANVDGLILAQRLTGLGQRPAPATRLRPARVATSFDGPGWGLELVIPWSAVDLDPSQPVRLQMATEHLAGFDRFTTWWLPTGGQPWLAARYATAVLAGN